MVERHGREGMPQHLLHDLVGLSRPMSLTGKRSSVRVNALCPGITTPDGAPDHPAQEALLPLVPLERLAKPEELVGAASYLSSPAASYTTGELLIVNGGRPW